MSSTRSLVRGLDYYRHTIFEFVTDRLGAQGTVIAGGRYDGLVETLGGPHTPAVGWAAGIERLAMMIDAPEAESPDRGAGARSARPARAVARRIADQAAQCRDRCRHGISRQHEATDAARRRKRRALRR